MHELPVTEDILRICLEAAEANGLTKILTIHLEIGALNDLKEEWLQQYFDFISRGTLAEQARLKVRVKPVELYCEDCRRHFTITLQNVETITCPACSGTRCGLRGGTGYYIENIEGV